MTADFEGTGVPLVTPFDADGALDEERLEALVGWLEDRGVDFLVPCGSTGTAPLLSADERERVVATVADAASVPVLAGTGRPGRRTTVETTERAAAAGADAALVVTPFYYDHDESALAAHYRAVADAADVPVFLYSVPKFTGRGLPPRTVEELSTHDGIAGMKDSSGDLEALQRERTLSADGFTLLVGSGSVYAHGLDAGADGGVLALANVAPECAGAVFDRHRGGAGDAARALNRDLVELNRAITARYGIPGVKAAMRARGAPAGHPRPPLRPVGEDARRELESLVAAAEPED